MAICLLLREIWWRKRLRNWIESEGKVIGGALIEEAEGPGVSCPIILYHFNGEELEQTCKRNLMHYKTGKTVSILINPDSGEIFVATFQDRWFLSAFLLGCVVAFSMLSFFSN
ncbi:MAG: hypothetical protein ABJM75_05845 [Luteolibacter sp.]